MYGHLELSNTNSVIAFLNKAHVNVGFASSLERRQLNPTGDFLKQLLPKTSDARPSTILDSGFLEKRIIKLKVVIPLMWDRVHVCLFIFAI